MAKKKEVKKAVKKAKPTKPSKPAKATKAAAKPAAKPAPKAAKKAAPAKNSKPAAKPAAKPVAKPAAKKQAPAKAVKPAKAKPAPKAPKGKPIDAVAKKKGAKSSAPASRKGGKAAADDEEDLDDEDIPDEEEEEEEDGEEVKDDYEKSDEEDVTIDEGLDEAPIMDLESGGAPDIDEDDDEVPEKRGRGRRKKNEGKSSGSSMEAYIRNRPLQIDISKPLVRKGNANEPKPFVNTDDSRSRYSDKELLEFKELILDKLREAQADYDLLKQTLSNEDNHGTDDTSPSFKLLEDGSDVMSKEETAQLASRQEKYIVNLKNALVRIENKSYGICRVTGKLIPKERLRSVPHATLGIDAKLGQN